MKKQVFVCASCGRERPLGRLSQESLDLNRTQSPVKALAVSDPDDLVCDTCTVDEDLGISAAFGRSDAESFEYSGTYVSDGYRQFLLNNY